MSTVMYTYWVDKDKVFELANRLCEFWKQRSVIFTHSQYYDYESIVKYSKDREYHVTLQLFDASSDRWLIRILSSGYMIENNIDQFLDLIEPCYYDDRTDIPDENIGNREYTVLLDGFINRKEYYLIPVVNDVDIIDNYFYHLHK